MGAGLFRHRMALLLRLVLVVFAVTATSQVALAQFSSGSDGRDGALSPTTTTVVIDMADHPDGIYQYTSVNIPAGTTVRFIPNAANTPVVWLVRDSCVIAGGIDVSGSQSTGIPGAPGGPGGYGGGNAAVGVALPGPGLGPGGGKVASVLYNCGGCASYGTPGGDAQYHLPSGDTYGNDYLLPLVGGSGGSGGRTGTRGGGGGGGAILIAATQAITISGGIAATGASSTGIKNNYYVDSYEYFGGSGSGGAIRLLASSITGSGGLNCAGGWATAYQSSSTGNATGGGKGRIRIEGITDIYNGSCNGVTSRGMTGIIMLPAAAAPVLSITKVGGVSVPGNPTGSAATPDVVLPAQLANPMTVEVHCTNLPLNTPVTVEAKPSNGANVSGVGVNSTGTDASSTALVPVSMPLGGGTLAAKASTAISMPQSAPPQAGAPAPPVAVTGLSTDGERFKSVEVMAAIGAEQRVVYVTDSGKRISLPAAK